MVLSASQTAPQTQRTRRERQQGRVEGHKGRQTQGGEKERRGCGKYFLKF
jgi:hypothetical protein